MRKILLLLLVGGIGAAAWWYLSKNDFVLWRTTTTTDATEQGGENTPEVPLVQPTPNAEGLSTYTDAQYGFTVSYPAGYKIGKVSEGEGHTFILQDAAGVGMQIVITPFDENSTLTTERIRQDLPEMPIENAQQVVFPGSTVQGVMFKSSGGGFGESIELWFVRGGHLYQASSYFSQFDFFNRVMGTFTF